jgi:hypothetical protein
MRYIKRFLLFLENSNIKYSGNFTTLHDGWRIGYSDYKNHYITDKLMERNLSISSDPVLEINKLIIKLIKYLENCKEEYVIYCVKFKNKKYYVIFEIQVKNKYIHLLTIKSLKMNIRKDTKIINI